MARAGLRVASGTAALGLALVCMSEAAWAYDPAYQAQMQMYQQQQIQQQIQVQNQHLYMQQRMQQDAQRRAIDAQIQTQRNIQRFGRDFNFQPPALPPGPIRMYDKNRAAAAGFERANRQALQELGLPAGAGRIRKGPPPAPAPTVDPKVAFEQAEQAQLAAIEKRRAASRELRSRRERLKLMVGGVVGLALVGGVAAFVVRRRKVAQAALAAAQRRKRAPKPRRA